MASSTVVVATAVLLQPALVLTDHGHFQYNSVALGFTVRSFQLFLFHLQLSLSL